METMVIGGSNDKYSIVAIQEASLAVFCRNRGESNTAER
jgi:hypothetical protein